MSYHVKLSVFYVILSAMKLAWKNKNVLVELGMV